MSTSSGSCLAKRQSQRTNDDDSILPLSPETMPSSLDPLPYLSPEASSTPRKSWTPFRTEPKTNMYVSSSSNNKQMHWIIIIYTMAALSTLTARYCVNLEDSVIALENKYHVISTQRDHLRQDLYTIEDYIETEHAKYQQLQHTRKALTHEVKVMAEYREETGRRQFVRGAGEDNNNHQATIQKWLATRHSHLLHRIQHLQKYLQRMSAAAVVRKFGAANTYRVELVVELQRRESLQREKMVIETVPLEYMPASIHMFLDTIHAGIIWDNAMFIHHQEDLDHVLPAAPVDYTTHTVRRTQIGSLGWNDLGFPEYHERFPHEIYTVGFAGLGPTFYINTMDNREDHGPGGQSHHLLPEDAEPCFGKVVEGQHIVDDLVKFGNLQTKMEVDADHPWADAEHRATRIVSAKVLTPKYVEL